MKKACKSNLPALIFLFALREQLVEMLRKQVTE